MDFIVREIQYSDYDQYIKLINDFRETTFTENEFIYSLNYLKSYSTIYVIEHNSILIATGTLIIEQKLIFNCAKLGHIEDVCVKKEYRRKGYGKEIVKKIVEEAKNRNCYKVTLTCSESNVDFYKTTGFEQRGYQMSQLLS